MSDDKKDLKASSDDLNKQILGAISKPYKGEQTSRWIKNLDDEALVEEITSAQPSSALNLTSPALLDRLFDEFQRYAYEYQNSPAAVQRFPINVGRPQSSDAPLSSQYGQVPILCKGHISTTNWAMIFFGFVGKVQAFVVPVEYTVGFQPSQKEFKPFVEMKSAPIKNENDWRIEDYSISAGLLPPLAKRFFGALIKVERGESKHTDQFIMDPTIPIEEPPPPARLEESDKVELLSDAVLQQEEARKRQFQQAGQQILQSANQQSVSQQSISRQSVSQPQPRYQASAPALPSTSHLPEDAASDSLEQAFERNDLMVNGALNEFIGRIDVEMDRLTKVGMTAVQTQDLVRAQQTIIRSAKLKEMRERVNDLSNEWNAVVQK